MDNSGRKVSLVLGGTKGLGAELVEQCLLEGDVVIRVGSSIRKQSQEGNLISLPCDLRNGTSVMQLSATLGSIPQYPINRFFWVAGKLLKGNLVDQFEDDLEEVVDVNLRNPLYIILPIWKEMQASGKYRQFVVVSSSSGVTPREDEAGYVATKYAQVGFTKSLGLENKNPNLQISLILPGGMQTPFWDKHPEIDTQEFLNPKLVAEKIMSEISNQNQPFQEFSIPRGSL